MNWSTDWAAAAAYASPDTPILIGVKGKPLSLAICISVEINQYGLFFVVPNEDEGSGLVRYYVDTPTHWIPCPLIAEDAPC